VGVDTHSWHHALKNTLRQAPDVILIGEIRDAETMEHASPSPRPATCVWARSTQQHQPDIDRIINFFPEERRNQLLMDLSANLRALVSQRLIRTPDGKAAKLPSKSCSTRRPSPTKSSKANSTRSKASWKSRAELGMRTFDWSLFELYNDGHISYEEAIRNADSATNCA